MNTCAYCHDRKGKRPCPALGNLICSLCCGEHRVTHISCPADCRYLDTGSEYQQKRLSEQFSPVRRDFYRELDESGGQKAVALFNLIEVITFSYFEGRRDGQDAEVITALQALRRTLSPLHVPAAPMPVFAEHLRKEYESFKKQNPEQIADSSDAPAVLDRIDKFVSAFSGKDFQSSRFLGGLIGYVKTHHPEIADHLKKKHEPGHIFLPGQSLLPAPPPLEEHTHGPDCRHHH
ncbi:MAG: hypothetical protein OEW32_08920 [Nitrospira sp.]|nr:hypothetical protein [Nitrospira sp.]